MVSYQPPVEKQPHSESTLPAYHHGTHTTYPAIIPYIPPAINVNISSSANHGSSLEKTETPQSEVVELPVLTRTYNPLESHFSEEPMTSINSDFPPPSSYQVSDIMKNWEESSKRNSVEKDVVNHEHNLDYDSNKENESDLIKKISDIPNSFSSSYENRKNNSVKHVDEMVSEINGSGLVSGLSSMSVYGTSEATPVLSDRERRFNWEKGQIDYMGADAFENIQRKLQESLKGPPEESPASNSSPFTPKQGEESVKTVAVVPETSTEVASVPPEATSAAPTTQALKTTSSPAPAPAKVTSTPAPAKVTTAPAPAPTKVTTAPAPAPTKVTTAPAPAKVTAAPAPAPKKVTAAPAPAKVTPAPAPAKVTPAPAPAKVTPAPAPAKVTPAPAPAKVTPAPAPAKVTPAPAPAKVTPAPAPAKVTPAPAPAKVTPVQAKYGAAAKTSAPASQAGATSTAKVPPSTAPKPQSPTEEKPASRFGMPSFLRKK